MLILYLSILTSSAIYAFDFGTQNVRIAYGVPGKAIEILPDNQGSRATPNYLAYSLNEQSSNISSAEWFVGQDAQRIIHKNLSHGVRNPFYFLASLADKENLFFQNIHPVTASSVAFSLLLNKFSKGQDKLIVAVPAVFSPQARHALIESLKTINITSVQLIDSNSAVASIYAVERLKKVSFSEDDSVTSKSIVFIDIGAIQAEVSFWNFTQIGNVMKIQLIDYCYSDEIGGDIIDDLLIKYITDRLPRTPTRAEMTTVLRSMKKAKERLASGSNQFIDLSEDFQQQMELSNDIINNLSQPLLHKLENLIKQIANNNNYTPDEIELIGGSTRLPSFQKVIQDAFPNYTLHRSLNSDEAIALGAAYYSSLQTGTIAGSRLEIIKPTIYGLDFETDGKNFELYKTGDISERKSMKMRKFKDFNFTMKVTKEKFDENGDSQNINNLHLISKLYNEVPEDFTHVRIRGLTNLTRSITKQLAKDTRPFIRFTFGLSQVYDCLDYISSALTANITVNVTIEGQVAQTNSSTSNWALSTKSTLNAPVFGYNETSHDEFMKQFTEAEIERKNHAKATHKIEAFIIDLTDKIEYDTDFQEVTIEEERSEIRDILSREREAIEFSGSRVHSTDLEKRFEKLREKLKEPLLRFKEYKARPAEIARLNKTIQKAEKALLNATTDNETIEDFKDFLNKTKNMIADAIQQKPLEKPTILASRLKERERNLQRMIPDLRRPARKKKPAKVTISTDPNSPDYDPELLKKYGINIQASDNSTNATTTVNVTSAANETDTANSTKTEPEKEQKRNKPAYDNGGGIQLLKDDDDKKKKLTPEEKKQMREKAKRERLQRKNKNKSNEL